MDDELVEDADLVIPGETSVGDSDASSTSNTEEDAPIRLLQDFTIYDLATNKMVPVGELLSLQYSTQKFGASGLVNAWTDVDVDEEEDAFSDTESLSISVTARPGERVKLSQVLEFSVHDFSNETKTLDRYELLACDDNYLSTDFHTIAKFISGPIMHGIYLTPHQLPTNPFLYASGLSIAFCISSSHNPSKTLE